MTKKITARAYNILKTENQNLQREVNRLKSEAEAIEPFAALIKATIDKVKEIAREEADDVIDRAEISLHRY